MKVKCDMCQKTAVWSITSTLESGTSMNGDACEDHKEEVKKEVRDFFPEQRIKFKIERIF